MHVRKLNWQSCRFSCGTVRSPVRRLVPRNNMAGACTTCKALRFNLALKRCLSVRFTPLKLKYTMPAAFLSSVGFVGCRRSSDDRISRGILWQRSRSALAEDFSVFCQVSRNLSSSVFRLQREPGEANSGTRKIKAKIEQMKEMVMF